MDVPGIVESALEGEDIAAEVSLGGENALYVTPTRTLIYQSEGFLSDESVDEYPHDAQRMTVKEGRRKTRISLDYSLDGTEEFTVPSNATDDVVHPVLAGVLNASGVTDPDEKVTRTFRLDELTLVITSARLVKHVGSAVWDEDYEEYHFADVTGLDFEDGSVATQLVLTVDGRPERMKVSNDRAAEVKEYLQRSLFSYYGVSSLDALNEAVAPEEADEADEPAAVDFGEGVDPLDAGNTVQPDDGGEATAPDPAPPQGDPLDTDQGTAASADPQPQAAEQPAAESGAGGQGGEASQPSTDQPATGRSAAGRSQANQTQPRSEPAETQQPETQQPEDRQPEPQQDPQGEPADPEGVTDAVQQESAPTATGSSAPTESSAATEPPTASESATDTAEATPNEVASTVEEAVEDDTGGEDTDDEDDEPLSDSKFAEAGFQPATSAGDEELLERIETLESKVDHQNELLQRQQDLLHQLVDELSRGR
ncbi:DUF7115 domain-containing protein [Haloarchaeobius baliensis]|uniref:DUF7115 domain-containing protein n=1 Tax=Haloarchaeobius baliensis TaxID=1670458 RepID=UPI003F8835A3